MKRLSSEMIKITENFVHTMKDAFENNLHAVILYGPAARGETMKVPYIRFMVVVDDNTPSELARCTRFRKEWKKNLITLPLFLTRDYIKTSCDTFPLEFMDMQSSHIVLHGPDVLENISFVAPDVRAQCEREIKGKLLYLRAEYLELRGDTKGLVDLVDRSLNTFRLLFSGVLFLKGLEIPDTTEKKIDAVLDAYGLDTALFGTLVKIASGRRKVNDAEADELFDRYVEELDKLSNAIDQMAV